MSEMILNLTDYQPRALATAKPTARSLEYLLPMIYSEVGEVIGKVAKAARDERDEEWLREALTLELGDVCWGVAVALHQLGASDESTFTGGVYLHYRPCVDYFRTVQRSPDASRQFLSFFVDQSFDVLMPYWDPDTAGEHLEILRRDLQVLWTSLRFASYSLTGHSFAYVLERNVEKLASRQARGVIGGDGDHR